MIVVKFFKTPVGTITGFEISGHSGFAKSGEDIVCASVSSAAYMTANTITDVIELNANVVVDEGHMSLSISKSDARKAQSVLKGFELHIKSLSNDYPKNIKVKFGGVRNA